MWWTILWSGMLGSNLTVAGAPALFAALNIGQREEDWRAAAHYLAAASKAAAVRGVRSECVTVTGDFPAGAIVAGVKRPECDFVLMVSQGRTGLPALLIGNQTRKIRQESKIPVLVNR